MTLRELGERLSELDDARALAEAELGNLRATRDRVERLQEDRDALLESMAATVPEALDGLTGEQRNTVYRMLRLEVAPGPGGYEVRGAFRTPEPTSAPRPGRSRPRARRRGSARPDGLTF